MRKFTKLTNHLPGFMLLRAVSLGWSISVGETLKVETKPGVPILERSTASIGQTGLHRENIKIYMNPII